MNEPTGWDAAKIADLAKQIGEQLVTVAARQKAKEEAGRDLSSAESQLITLRGAFTRAVESQLDRSIAERVGFGRTC